MIATSALLLAMADRIDMPRALHRGRYQRVVAPIETVGIPVDTAAVAELLDNRTALKLDYIERNNMGEFFDGTRFVGGPAHRANSEKRLGDALAVNAHGQV